MSTILYIAEKASVGRALANVLPGNKVKEGNHIRCGANIVAWASGHLLGLCQPKDYDTRYRVWSLDSLPIIPAHWKLRELEQTEGLLKELKSLLKEATKVVHAGDNDREGQLLIDEILEYCGWNGPTGRLRINDVNPDAIRKALNEVKDNSLYRGESLAGKARGYADWLVGVNLSRCCTLHFRNAGYEQTFSAGRVQTPTLGLVVRRDREIANFAPEAYYELFATLLFPTGNRKLSGRWIPGATEADFLDKEGRLIDGPICEALEEKLTGATGTIRSVDRKMRKEAPPLPYNLARLQIEASKKYDITDTLTHAQKLYEQGYITYPRSDCRYIPEGHHKEAPKVLQATDAGCPGLRDLLKNADVTRKNSAWDDSRVTEHHAITPTVRVPLKNALSENERKIYDLICVRYALQFLPDHECRETTVEFEAGGERFRTSGREVVVSGWKRVGGAGENESADDSEGNSSFTTFPAVAVGESGPVIPRVEEKMTTPPRRFTYDTLIGAMNSIHLYVEDPEIRKQLKALDGIGTSATQESIVGLLFERGYIEKRGKQIFSTPAGQSLIDLLNTGKGAVLARPELTALWEQKMTRIEKGELELDVFVSEVAAMVGEIVKAPVSVPEIPGAARMKKCLTENCGGYLRHISKDKDSFFACPVCGRTFKDRDGEPVAKRQAEGGKMLRADCPLGCGRQARRLSGPYGFFWKCDCEPDKTFNDVDGKPAVKEERPKAKCPVKECRGTVERYRSKNSKRLFWKCGVCRDTFDDSGGKPVNPLRRRRELR
jgi:DNA topoisomerase-3